MRKHMKKLFITLLILSTLAVNIALAKSFIDEVNDIVGSDPKVNINLGIGIIKTILAFSDDDDAKEANALMAGLNKVRVAVYELNENVNVNKVTKKIVNQVSKLSSLGYEKLVTVKEGSETVNILAKVNDQFLQDAMIIVMEDDELVIISLDGEVDLKQLAQISEEFDVDIEDVLDI